MDRGLTLTETLLGQAGVRPITSSEDGWEVGRLVLAETYRSDPDALKHCLFLALSYLCAHTDAENLYASCSHVLSRLYRRFGFSIFAKDVKLRGTQKSYALIHGRGSQILEALAGSSKKGLQ